MADIRTANAEAQAWRESERRYNERQRREQVAELYRFHADLEELHRGLAEEHAARALALLEEHGGRG